jgi:hypothetical protein
VNGETMERKAKEERGNMRRDPPAIAGFEDGKQG